ncbi:hypothetical protein CXF83_12290 [Shewanella sp. Choline-02u-19]|uniref:hypothetical protein n=1 Tax=unclassified Shewanella TaxID=196818 RepID=UPI000C3414DB|nr:MULTISPECIES: hypothetical protein [unclassified Shewanella]PKG75284.1 hypothetical protein CXF86_07870 [Shewanella sp. GutCb]PKH58021.1 hypothetical protein CXF84_06980 [Shewanella sp. Bg11-22]PKI27430.1 hypothetical protein CXF83_12290 [Shewanella sp. Choline-02u-19]
MIKLMLLTATLMQAGYTESPQVPSQTINKAQLIVEIETDLTNTMVYMTKALTENIVATEQGSYLQLANKTSLSSMAVTTYNVAK